MAEFDMKSVYRADGRHYVVRELELDIDGETAGGILLPSNREKHEVRSVCGEIVSKGRGYYTDDGTLITIPHDVGDVIFYSAAAKVPLPSNYGEPLYAVSYINVLASAHKEDLPLKSDGRGSDDEEEGGSQADDEPDGPSPSSAVAPEERVAAAV